MRGGVPRGVLPLPLFLSLFITLTVVLTLARSLSISLFLSLALSLSPSLSFSSTFSLSLALSLSHFFLYSPLSHFLSLSFSFPALQSTVSRLTALTRQIGGSECAISG